MATTRREKYEQRLKALKEQRQSWEPAWKDITEQLVPYRTVWDSQYEKNRGDRKDTKIRNSRPVQAVKTLAAGMMAGVTSPARPWFKLGLNDADLSEHKTVRVYLDKCERAIANAFHRSNFYKSLSGGTYPDLCSIATSAMFEEETPDGRIRFYPMPIGEYYLDVNHEEIIDTCFRELSRTTRQLVGKFGLKNVSQGVRQAWDDGKYERPWRVVHAVMPNDEYAHGRIGRHGMRFASCWWEATDDRKDAFLYEGGYEEFPVHAPRWMARPGDVYGRGPGWDVRGDCKMLQFQEAALVELVDKTTKPPLKIVGNVTRMSIRPGDYTQVAAGQQATAEPMMIVDPRSIEVLEAHIDRTERRIQEALYANLWQLLIQDERAQRPTATEVEAKRQEVALMLGPLLENLNDELLEPVVERTFAILDRQGLLPPPEEVPDEIQGQDLKVEFVSIMHQMQQATGLVSIRTFMQELANVAQFHPDVVDKVDADAIVDELVRITGVRPGTVLDKDEVEKVRGAKAQQEQAKQQGEAMLAATQGAKNLGSVDPTKLSEVAGMLTPVAAAQGGALGGVAA